MMTDSAVSTIRYGIQLPRLEKLKRKVVYNSTPMVATSTSIISDGESRAPRRRSSDSRLSRSGADGDRSSDSFCSRDMAVGSPKERIRDGAGVYSRFNNWRISNDQPLEIEPQCSGGSDPTFVIERS